MLIEGYRYVDISLGLPCALLLSHFKSIVVSCLPPPDERERAEQFPEFPKTFTKLLIEKSA